MAGAKNRWSGEQFDKERALYGLRGAEVSNCVFGGPGDGESSLKECRGITVSDCTFDLRYPLWHCDNFTVERAKMSDLARAALWYDTNGVVRDSELHGIKAIRECRDVSIEGCDIISPEFGWKCENLRVTDCNIEAQYVFLDCINLHLRNVEMDGKYGFQYVIGGEIEDSRIVSKDGFWHSRGVTIRNSVVAGEYLGWYSDGLTLENCRIMGTQPLCYCTNLTLINCTMAGCDLAFEYSDVNADVRSRIRSVKNPRSGRIVADEIGELVYTDSVYDCSCEIELR